MKNTLLIFLTCLTHISWTQTTGFQISINDNKSFNYPASCIEGYNNDLIVSRRVGNFLTEETSTIISSIDMQGNIIQNKRIEFDTLSILQIQLVKSKKNIYGFAMSVSKNLKNFYLDVLKFDSNFNIISQSGHLYSDLFSDCSVIEDTLQNNFLVTSAEIIDNVKISFKTTFRRFDYNGNQVNVSEYPPFDFSNNVILVHNSLNKIVCGHSGYLIVSPDDQILENYILPSNIGSQGNIKWLKDSTYLHIGRDEYKIGLCMFEIGKPAKKTILLDKLFPDNDYVEFPAFLVPIDFIKPNKIFFSGISNVGTNQTANFESTDKSKIIIGQIDDNLKTIWTRYFGGDAYYATIGTLATSDGGCVVTATRYDSNKPNQTSMYIIKVNDKGEVTATTDIPDEYTQLIAYPNPGNDVIHVKVPFQVIENNQVLDFDLFDLQGKKVLTTSQTIDNQKVEINIGNQIPSGSYLFVLKKNRQVLGTGKWIKL